MKKIIIIIGLMAIVIYDNCFATLKTIYDHQQDTDKKHYKEPIRTTWFINGKVNDIFIKITYDKNQLNEKIIKMGHKYTYHHKPKSVKKVVCFNTIDNEKPVTITESDLNTYSVFVFTTDRIEKYHFIDQHHKDLALKHAKNPYNEKLYNEIDEMTLYNP